jgi:assimilatory nitrate reductase catalytic subunit
VTAVLRDSFLVVQDAFRTETVELADVVLPAATWGETEGTATNMERRVSRVTGAVEPPGSARQDVDIIAAIGNRLEAGLLPEPPLDPAAVFEAVRELTAGTTADLSGISYDRLSAESAVRWPAPDERTQGGYRYHDDGGWTFETESGLARFSTATHDGTPEPADADYPLVLTTGRRAGAYNTGVRTRQHTPVPPNARVHPETIGEHLGSFDRGRTVVESRRDSVLVSVESDDSVPPGLVWVPIHNPLVNGLTLPEVDPDSGEPNFKQCAVTVRAPPGRSQSPATADSSGHSPARR